MRFATRVQLYVNAPSFIRGRFRADPVQVHPLARATLAHSKCLNIEQLPDIVHIKYPSNASFEMPQDDKCRFARTGRLAKTWNIE